MGAETVTVDALFALAIAAEEAAEQIYCGLEMMFRHVPQVARFWRDYAAQEAGHAHWLERIRDELTPEERAAPANLQWTRDLQERLRLSPEHILQRVKTLEDAYQMVHERESAETNAMFEFLVNSFARSPQAQAFLRAQLHDHIARIMKDFPPLYGDIGSRMAVRAINSTSGSS